MLKEITGSPVFSLMFLKVFLSRFYFSCFVLDHTAKNGCSFRSYSNVNFMTLF